MSLSRVYLGLRSCLLSPPGVPAVGDFKDFPSLPSLLDEGGVSKERSGLASEARGVRGDRPTGSAVPSLASSSHFGRL